MNHSLEHDLSLDQQPYIAGFWRRTCAFLLDLFHVGMCCWLVASLLGQLPYQYPIQITLAGYLCVVLYFTLCSSVLTEGHTIGKRLMSIQVVSLDQQSLSLFHAFLRSAILCAPFCLASLTFLNQPWINLALVTSLGGLLISLLYLYIFNRKNRRSTHDYIAGSMVVKTSVKPQPIQATWNIHFYIALVLICLYTANNIWNYSHTNQDYVPTALQNLQFKDLNHFDYGFITFPENEQGISPTQHFYQAKVTNPELLNSTAYAEEFAQYISKVHPDFQAAHTENYVILSAGYQFGLIAKRATATFLISNTSQRMVAEKVSYTDQFIFGGAY